MANTNGSPSPRAPPSKEDAAVTLQSRILHRQASLTEGESAFLHALLIDPLPRNVPKDDSEHSRQMAQAAETLNDDILFSTPFVPNNNKAPPKPKRRQTNWVGLWQAFEDGVHPRRLVQRAPPKSNSDSPPREVVATTQEKTQRHGNLAKLQLEDNNDDSDVDSIPSDERVLTDKGDRKKGDDDSSASSWADSEGDRDHYDAWAVLKDEYAEDFGFDYSLRSTPDLDDDEEGNKFIILGTSADDKSAQPHVLSPPLMDSLMNFLPEGLSKQNWWLRYSLVRDGASLDTFKQYLRGAQYTLLAIETTQGDVFGAFTGSYWRTNPRFYGSGESFVWKMRYNRMTPCTSLFEQAQLEADIDVYVYAHLNRFVQLSTHDMLAIGGGKLPAEEEVKNDEDNDDSTGETPIHHQIELEDETGFALALTDDMLRGTSSPCATFRSPCLVHNHSSRGETFEVVNIEAWTFTPCYSVDSAEKLELTKFFVQESTRTLGSTEHSLEELIGDSPSLSGSHESPRFTSRDLIQKKFYRRVGENDEGEQERNRWSYANMMG